MSGERFNPYMINQLSDAKHRARWGDWFVRRAMVDRTGNGINSISIMLDGANSRMRAAIFESLANHGFNLDFPHDDSRSIAGCALTLKIMRDALEFESHVFGIVQIYAAAAIFRCNKTAAKRLEIDEMPKSDRIKRGKEYAGQRDAKDLISPLVAHVNIFDSMHLICREPCDLDAIEKTADSIDFAEDFTTEEVAHRFIDHGLFPVDKLPPISIGPELQVVITGCGLSISRDNSYKVKI